MWATAWEHEANEVVAPWLGLPELPVVEFPPAEEDDLRVGLHFKTRALVGWAAGRPFAWVDDEITGTDREWVRARHPGSALLHCATRSTALPRMTTPSLPGGSATPAARRRAEPGSVTRVALSERG